MKVHQKFSEELGKLRKATVGDIITGLGIVEIENGGRTNISNLKDGLEELEQIFFTIDYLKEHKLVEEESRQEGNYIPDFNPTNFFRDGNNKYFISQMHSMPHFLRRYWGIGLIINPAYSKFISNGFKTDEEINNVWNRWLPFGTAIVASFTTAVLTAYLTQTTIVNCR